MRPLRISLAVAIAAGLLFATFGSTSVAQSDTTPPVIVYLTINDPVLDFAAGETLLDIDYRITDDMSGLNFVEPHLLIPTPPGFSSYPSLPGYSGLQLDHVGFPPGQLDYTGQAQIDFAAPNQYWPSDGQYSVVLRMADQAGNWAFLPVTAQHPVVTIVNSQTASPTSACYTASVTDRVFYAPFDTVIGPDVISNTPNSGTPTGPNRYLTATTIPGHTGQVLHLNAIPRHETTNYTGRVRYLRDGMTGRSPFAFRRDDFSINFWMRTTNDHARLIGTRQRNNDSGHRQRGIMVNLQNGQLEFQMNLGEAAQGSGPWFRNWSGGSNIADGGWHMITVTVDRDSATGGELRVDGAVVATFDPTGFTGNLGNRNFLGLGFDGVTQGNDGDFEIDEIEIYHRVLQDAEISARFARPLCP